MRASTSDVGLPVAIALPAFEAKSTTTYMKYNKFRGVYWANGSDPVCSCSFCAVTRNSFFFEKGQYGG